LKIIKGRPFNPGDKKPLDAEERLEDIKFNIFKFNERPKPQDKRQILILTNFSEFGCESIALLYCIPKILKNYPGAYVIAVGWYGREYLYRHLVDEFWEIKEEHQWLREYSRAFGYESKNLERLEKNLSHFGRVYTGQAFGNVCLGNVCRTCKHFWGDSDYVQRCVKCQSPDVERSLFGDILHYRSTMVPIPKPKQPILEKAKEYLDRSWCKQTNVKGTVGVFARARTCYGRNLPPEFYQKLLHCLDELGYRVIWLGEKQSTLPVPVGCENVFDFTRDPNSRDLELLLGIVSQLQFTVQFWTASTRFASMMGVPWILFESPDQIVGVGQEGMRIALTTDDNKKKLVLSHYLNVLNNQDDAIDLVKQAIDEISSDNWNDIVGLVEEKELVQMMLEKRQQWVGNECS
jgi:hypothetical protein